ncbi:MAG: tetraacyldisaccharide 4'-kinase [Methylotenera sp.]|nr:tetraacyldisaccharide 4'-kinase [Oligoflexia bacterium]
MNGLLLAITSTIWSFLSATAWLLLKVGVLKGRRLPVRVISVGNIQVGGSGKTPLVAQIAREAHERGLKVCILCRGYGSEWEGGGGTIAPLATSATLPDPRFSGDEAALLHELAPHAWIGVGANRVRQFRRVDQLALGGFNIAILDDGFQHWKIQKDLEIVAMTSLNRFQTLFRDWDLALRRAHLLVWTKGDCKPAAIRSPCVRVRYNLPLNDGVHRERHFWMVTGLGDSEFAQKTAEKAGYIVVNHVRFRDHAIYEKEVVLQILHEAQVANCSVVVTGKDWVKWQALGISKSNVVVLEPELLFEEGKNLWDQALWGSLSSRS